MNLEPIKRAVKATAIRDHKDKKNNFKSSDIPNF